VGAYVTKLAQLQALMAAGDWDRAITFAARFQQLGDARNDILSAREALLRPDFQRQLGRDPVTLRAAGIAALQRRYAPAKAKEHSDA